jgi:phage terminase large subunit
MGSNLKLITKQEYAVYFLKDQSTKEIVYGGAAGGGKSALGCLWLIEMCQTYKGSRWIMGRSKLKTLKETTLATFFELAGKLKIMNQFNYNQQSGVIYWNNGSEILLKDLFLYPSDPEFDSLGSLEISGAFIDEVSQITFKAWQIVQSRCRYKLNEFGIIPKILGTCNPTKKWVYKEFFKPWREKKLETKRAFVQALPTDNPHLPSAYLESLLALDDTSKQRLYYGNWEYDDDPAKLIEFDAIIDLWNNTHVLGGTKYITADIARFGSDKGVIGVWDGLILLEVVTLDHSSVTDTAKKIKELQNKYGVMNSNTICDEDGVGGGVVDILGCKGFVNGSTPLKEEFKKVEYANLKTQCYYHLADSINKGQIYLSKPFADISEKLIEELEQVKRDKVDEDGKLYLLAKEKVKEILGRSPDYSDMLMMREWFKLKPLYNFEV